MCGAWPKHCRDRVGEWKTLLAEQWHTVRRVSKRVGSGLACAGLDVGSADPTYEVDPTYEAAHLRSGPP